MAVLARPLSTGLALLPTITERGVEPGGTAQFRVLLANVGDFDDNVTFLANGVPAGWSLRIGLNASTAVDVAAFAIALEAGQDVSLIVLATSPPDVLRGTSVVLRLDAVSERVGDAVVADVELFAYINDPLGIGRLGRHVWLVVILFAILVAIAVAIDAVKRQRFGVRP